MERTFEVKRVVFVSACSLVSKSGVRSSEPSIVINSNALILRGRVRRARAEGARGGM